MPGWIRFIVLPAFFPLAVAAQENLALNAAVATATKPWTSLDLNNDPSSFQFAIVSDNAGGPRQGVFAEAVLKLNLLQPEFVMGIGDFIEGYVDLRQDLELQWDRFMEDLAPLEMPFFFLPGNHDNGRPLWAEVYNARFGVPYYHFVYKNVLFLCVSTNDGPENNTGIGQEQIDYFAKVLKENAEVRWTLVFQHKPLWNDKGAQGWPEMAKLLTGRKCTIFAGHTHHYLSQVRDGISYITLATTGGGSGLRGPNYGEFDQVAWVTLKDDGPRVANLLLDGILDKDFRTEKEAKQFGLFSADKAVRATPILVDSATFEIGVSRLTITNPAEKPLRFKALFELAPGMRIEPGSIAAIVPPGEKHEVDLRVTAEPAIGLQAAQPLVIHWEGHYDRDDNRPSTDLSGQYRVPIDGPFVIPVVATSPQVDGDLKDWPDLPFVVEQPAEIFFNVPAWKGPEDGTFRFGVGRDDRFLYVAIETHDDEPCFEGWKYWEDFAMVNVDARISEEGDADTSVFSIATGPEMSLEQASEYEAGKAPEGLQRAARRTEDGFVAEVAIPLTYLQECQGGDWTRVRLNVTFSDFDRRDERDGVTILCWRPQWTGSRNYPEEGMFLRETSSR